MKAIKNYAKASATGRMDVMGGIADYSGSLLLQKAIHASTTVEITLNDSNTFVTTSGGNRHEFDYVPMLESTSVTSYDSLRNYFKNSPQDEWVGYVVGCFFVLKNEKNIALQGATITVTSDVPIGKGVSSSAALEVATMKALQQLYGLEFQKTELSILAQKVENAVVGAPCGLMDQLACYYGNTDSLLPIICQPATLFDPIAIPKNIQFIGIDSGVKHAVSGASYSDVRTAAAMGYSIIAQFLGLKATDLEVYKNSKSQIDLPFDGYIANCTVSEFEKNYRHLLPLHLSGADFIANYQTTIDHQAFVNESTIYQIAASTQHPIYENFRVNSFLSILESINNQKDATERQLNLLGELMFQSHASYSACGLGETQTDMLVAMAQKYKNKGIYGAKITGGGSGGTVCLLTHGQQGLDAALELHQKYQQQYGKEVMWIV